MKKKPTTKGRKRIEFKVAAAPGSEVLVAGTFNNWDDNSIKMKNQEENGAYSAKILLAPGTYEYKFIINGEWHADPNCPNWVQNSQKNINCFRKIYFAIWIHQML